MPLQVNHCLVCDDVRPDLGNKLSLLGFYGVAPDLNIKMKDPEMPIAGLAIVFIMTRESTGSYSVKLLIEKPSGGTLLESPPIEARVAGDNRLNLIWKFNGFKFPELGSYALKLIVDDDVIFTTSFLTEQASREDIVATNT